MRLVIVMTAIAMSTAFHTTSRLSSAPAAHSGSVPYQMTGTVQEQRRRCLSWR